MHQTAAKPIIPWFNKGDNSKEVVLFDVHNSRPLEQPSTNFRSPTGSHFLASLVTIWTIMLLLIPDEAIPSSLSI